jgi:DNA-binding MarR family transcriptional regulator
MATDDEREAELILRAVLALGRRLRQARPAAGLSLAALSALGALARLGPLPAARLAAEERLQPQSLTRLMARLERDGLIERRPGPADRRERLVALTGTGRAALAADLAGRAAWLNQALAGRLDAAGRRQLAAAAEAMLRLAEEPRGADEP